MTLMSFGILVFYTLVFRATVWRKGCSDDKSIRECEGLLMVPLVE